MNKMQWKYTKPLVSVKQIGDFEKAYSFSFDDIYRDYVRQYNGGRPSPNAFDTEKSKARSIKALLSFNKSDKENIWDMNAWIKEAIENRYVAFGIDSFGNLICFEKFSDDVIFWNHENGSIEIITKGFGNFINSLY